MPERLRPDCGSCFGLCCVALPFAASSDFAVDKVGGTPCRNLADDDTCRIHDRLRSSGYRGCTVFDCLGAGQHTSAVVFRGVSWRSSPDVATSMFSVFPVVRQLFELLWYLEAASRLDVDAATRKALMSALEEVEAAAALAPADLETFDVAAVRGSINDLLLRSSASVRSTSSGPRRGVARRRLLGKDLRSRDFAERAFVALSSWRQTCAGWTLPSLT